MTNYVKSTNFASKDSLASGNPLKIVKGTEIDIEFNNIADAIETKIETSALEALYPIGSVYINASVTTNPSVLLGFGTWVSFGAGRVLVGLNGSDTLFDTLEETGGSKDAVVVSHTHTVNDPGHAHTYDKASLGTAVIPGGSPNYNPVSLVGAATGSAITGISLESTGVSETNANLQPYITVAMWKRTA